mmetsp:Transcript_31702/g.76041  ORF Transcript_31702/g.76041 Transcript_31702/m.76041 type:complete len:220 (-) Transcript_31702:88-747(-)
MTPNQVQSESPAGESSASPLEMDDKSQPTPEWCASYCEKRGSRSATDRWSFSSKQPCASAHSHDDSSSLAERDGPSLLTEDSLCLETTASQPHLCPAQVFSAFPRNPEALWHFRNGRAQRTNAPTGRRPPQTTPPTRWKQTGAHKVRGVAILCLPCSARATAYELSARSCSATCHRSGGFELAPPPTAAPGPLHLFVFVLVSDAHCRLCCSPKKVAKDA